MAKTISDEKLKMSIVIDSNQAQKELLDLEKATRSLTEENKSLQIQKKALERQGKKDSDAYRDVTRAIKENNVAITSNKEKMKSLQEAIGLTALSMKQLGDRARILRFSLNNAIPGSEAYRNYQTELNAVTARMDELRGRATGTRASIDRLADGFNRYAAIGASVIGVFTGVILSLQKMIDYNGQLSDAQANVMKTTRMSKKEVDELTKSFGLLQTRTSRIDLLKIAEEGGRIGIAKNEVGQFVEVMNKATVALGDSFTGGVSEVAEKLGKLKFLFKETKDLSVDEAYNSIGSAINELGADGVASERNIADFATRLGALPNALKPTIQEALALGAAFEESGVDSEIAARAYNIFLKQAATETAKFSQAMGITQEEVKNLINTNPMEFFLQFSEGAKGLEATDIASILTELGINADGANKVIATAGDNIQRFRSRLDLSNQSFKDASSLMDEFNIKNNTLGATLEKIKKGLLGAFSSEALVNGLTNVVNWIGKVIGVTEDADGSGRSWRNSLMALVKVLAVVIATVLSYRAGLQLATLWSNRATTATALSNIVFKIHYGLLVVQEIATKALALAKALLTFRIGQARIAYTALMASMSLNPWGALIAIIGAAVAAYAVFANSTDETNVAMNQNLKVANSVAEATGKQKQGISDLIKVMKDENATLEQKQKALQMLKDVSDGYLETLTLENIATAEGERLINRYIAAVDRLALAKALVEVKSKLMADKMNSDNKVLALSMEQKENKNEGAWGGGDDGLLFGMGSRNKKEIQLEIEKEKLENEKLAYQQTSLDLRREKEKDILTKNIKKKTEAMKLLKADSAKYKELAQDVATDTNALNIIIGLGETKVDETPKLKNNFGNGKNKSKDDAKKALERKLKDQADELKKLNDERLRLIRESEDAYLASLPEGYDKEKQIAEATQRRKIEDLKARLTSEADIEKAFKQSNNDKLSDDEKAFWKNKATIWSQNNQELHYQINSQEAVHNLKMATIQEKAAADEIKTDQENYERAKIIRQTKHNEALLALGDNKRAKEKLQKEFDANELTEEEKHLKSVVDTFKKVIGKENFEGFDLSLLTPDQVDEFTKLLEKAGLALSDFLKSKDNTGKLDSQEALTSLGLGGKADILGFTPENWLELFNNLETGKNGIESMVFAVQALTNMYQMYSNFLAANEQAQLEKFTKASETKKTKLKRQLDAGYLSQHGYNKQVEKIDNDLAKKKAEIDYKQAKRQKMITAANVINATAQAIISIWAQFPKADFGVTAAIMSGVVGSLGALQLATVMATPLPAKGYEKGLYPDYVNVQREQDGKMYRPRNAGKLKSGLVTQNSLMVAEGNKPEMVIDNKAWSRISPEVQNALIREIRGAKGFEQGYYKNNVLNTGSTSTAPAPSTSNSDAMLEMVLIALNQNTQAMNRLEEKTFEAVVDPKKMKNIKNLKDGFKEFENIKNRAKK